MNGQAQCQRYFEVVIGGKQTFADTQCVKPPKPGSKVMRVQCFRLGSKKPVETVPCNTVPNFPKHLVYATAGEVAV